MVPVVPEVVIQFLLRLALFPENCKGKLFLKSWDFCLQNNLNWTTFQVRFLKWSLLYFTLVLLQLVTAQLLHGVDVGCPNCCYSLGGPQSHASFGCRAKEWSQVLRELKRYRMIALVACGVTSSTCTCLILWTWCFVMTELWDQGVVSVLDMEGQKHRGVKSVSTDICWEMLSKVFPVSNKKQMKKKNLAPGIEQGCSTCRLCCAEATLIF